MIPKDAILSRIRTYLMLLNSGQSSHSPWEAEDFYCGLLNTILDTNLQNLNTQDANMPAIDLGDEGNRICVRLSAISKYSSIDSILDTFLSNGLHRRYSRLIILDLNGNEKSYTSSVIADDFSFVPERDIWNIEYLLRKIETMDTDRMERLCTYLATQLILPEAKSPPLNLPLPSVFPHEDFVGRINELASLEAAIKEGRKPVLLSGRSGMGKTRLACQFGRNYAAQGKNKVYYAPFRHTFSRTVVDYIAGGLPTLPDPSLSEEQNIALTLARLTECSEHDLLIIDGVDDPGQTFSELTSDPVYAQLCTLPLRLLFTTRYCEPGSIIIAALPTSDLYFLFRDQRLNLSAEDMDELIQSALGHRLTIALIARTLANPSVQVTPQQIAQALQKCNLDQAAVSAASDSRRIAASVHAHLRALFSLCHFSEREAAVLRCATLFPPDGISVSLLQTCLSQLTGEDIFRIVQRGWLNCQNNLLTVHPTVRAVLQEVLKPSDQNCYTFLSTLEKESDRMDFDLTILRQMAVVFSMAAGFLEDAKGNWALNAGKLWIRLNEGSQALKHICPVLERWQKCPPENPQNLISAYHQAGVSYMYQNDFKQAEKHLTAALAQSAPDNPQRATYLNNLATVYNRLGDYGQSLKYSLEALKRQNNSRNPLTLASVYNNIGLAYAGLEDHSSALMYQEKALQLHQDTLPVDHPDFAASLNNIGMAYAQQGKQDSALEYLKRALVIREKLYHENHPSIVTSCNNIGGLFSAKGNYDEALKYLYRAVSIGETVLPKGHPDLAAAYGNLGAAYEMQNRNLEALDFYKKAVVAIQVGSSENRTQLANYLALAAFVNAKLSNFAEAIQFMRQAIDCIQDSLPEDHPVLTNYQKYLDAFERIQQSSGEFGAIYRSSQTEANAE